jgi:hypothetical protein
VFDDTRNTSELRHSCGRVMGEMHTAHMLYYAGRCLTSGNVNAIYQKAFSVIVWLSLLHYSPGADALGRREGVKERLLQHRKVLGKD